MVGFPSTRPGRAPWGQGMRLVGAPVVLEGGVVGVVVRHTTIGSWDKFFVATGEQGLIQVERDGFEILPPEEAESHGLRLVYRRGAAEGRLLECTGDGPSPHRPWRSIWVPVSVSRTLCALCPACGIYYLGDEEEGG